jgi:predicted Zn-dependent protease
LSAGDYKRFIITTIKKGRFQMPKKHVILSFCILILIASAFFGGCATTSQLEEVRETAEQALRMAEDARRQAESPAEAEMDGQARQDLIAEQERLAQEAKEAADRAEAAAEKSERIFDKMSGK